MTRQGLLCRKTKQPTKSNYKQTKCVYYITYIVIVDLVDNLKLGSVFVEIIQNVQNSNCTAIYLPSYKPFKKDEQYTVGTAGESIL